jgi:ATP-dependent DNA ligase
MGQSELDWPSPLGFYSPMVRAWAVQLNEHIAEEGDIVFRHACKLGFFEGIVSKRLGSPYVSGRSRHWIKSKNPAAPNCSDTGYVRNGSSWSRVHL